MIEQISLDSRFRWMLWNTWWTFRNEKNRARLNIHVIWTTPILHTKLSVCSEWAHKIHIISLQHNQSCRRRMRHAFKTVTTTIRRTTSIARFSQQNNHHRVAALFFKTNFSTHKFQSFKRDTVGEQSPLFFLIFLEVHYSLTSRNEIMAGPHSFL